MLLTAEHITFSYRAGRRAPVLRDISLALSSGERVGLQAPSGRGKTTLCRLLAGYERPQKGEVLLDGKPLSAYAGPCPVQMVWQHPETVVDPLLPLGKTLAESGMPEQRLLDALHIREGWLTRYPGELSGGELQRFCIARALATNPRYLVADEISTMLDALTQAQLWEFLLAEVEARGMGLVFVSHSPALTARIATRTVNLADCSCRA